jgi:nucleotidyltransferase/DNA polymerase involved in DNA repair
MQPLLALVDCNNFYVSCERVFRPDLIGKPVAVLSNNDGCIVARSAEVKDLGIKMGGPVFQVQHLVKQHNIQLFSSNYQHDLPTLRLKPNALMGSCGVSAISIASQVTHMPAQ